MEAVREEEVKLRGGGIEFLVGVQFLVAAYRMQKLINDGVVCVGPDAAGDS